MNLVLAIVLIVVALIGGVALGFFIARKYMMNYLKENPPINEQMLRMMMMQMGQKPSQKKINQMMAQMNKVQDKPDKKISKNSVAGSMALLYGVFLFLFSRRPPQKVAS